MAHDDAAPRVLMKSDGKPDAFFGRKRIFGRNESPPSVLLLLVLVAVTKAPFAVSETATVDTFSCSAALLLAEQAAPSFSSVGQGADVPFAVDTGATVGFFFGGSSCFSRHDAPAEQYPFRNASHTCALRLTLT
ncbi:hypothetical protein FI667_g16673, partial [Globisporangium splendens]